MTLSSDEEKMLPRVLIDPVVYRKIMHWVDKAVGEISGLGNVETNENGDIIVTSAILVEQENTSSTTDLKPEAVAKAMYELKDQPGEMRFWWHSHVNMGVFWSGTDTETMRLLGEHGWFVSTVFNKKREWRTAIYQKKPYRVFRDEIQTLLMPEKNPELTDAWDKEFDAKCTTKTYGQQSGFGRYPSRLDFDDDFQDPLTQAEKEISSAYEETEQQGRYTQANRYMSKELVRLLAIQDVEPFWMDQSMVHFRDGSSISRYFFEDKYNIDLTDPDILEYLDYAQ